MELPHSEKQDWYLVQGADRRQWFDETPLEAVLGMAMLMTGSGGLSGADEVTLEDKDKKPIVTFIANEGHQGCHLVIPIASTTTREDLELLTHFMAAHQLLTWEGKQEIEIMHGDDL